MLTHVIELVKSKEFSHNTLSVIEHAKQQILTGKQPVLRSQAVSLWNTIVSASCHRTSDLELMARIVAFGQDLAYHAFTCVMLEPNSIDIEDDIIIRILSMAAKTKSSFMRLSTDCGMCSFYQLQFEDWSLRLSPVLGASQM